MSVKIVRRDVPMKVQFVTLQIGDTFYGESFNHVWMKTEIRDTATERISNAICLNDGGGGIYKHNEMVTRVNVTVMVDDFKVEE